MNFSSIIYNGVKNIDNKKNLDAYFIREYKKAERDNFYSIEEFFNPLFRLVDSYRKSITEQFEKSKEWYQNIISKAEKNDLNFRDYYYTHCLNDQGISYDEFKKEQNKRELKESQDELANLSIDKVFTKDNAFNLSDLKLIEEALKKAKDVLQAQSQGQNKEAKQSTIETDWQFQREFETAKIPFSAIIISNPSFKEELYSQFRDAQRKPCFDLYLAEYYSDEELKQGFEEIHKQIPVSNSMEIVAANFVTTTPFESHVMELNGQFTDMVVHKKLPSKYYCPDIEKTVIVQALKAISDEYELLKKSVFDEKTDKYKEAEIRSKNVVAISERLEGFAYLIIEHLRLDNDNIYLHLKKADKARFDFWQVLKSNFTNSLIDQEQANRFQTKKREVDQEFSHIGKREEQPKFIANEYALAYIFDLYSQGKQIPKNIVEGSYDAKELRRIGKEVYQFEKPDTFYRAVLKVASYDLNKNEFLGAISNRWLDAVRALSKNWNAVSEFLTEKQLIRE
jgi:hypothetical protein